MRIIADFSLKIIQGRKQQTNDFKVLEGKINLEFYSLWKYLWKLNKAKKKNLFGHTKAERINYLEDILTT